MRKAWFDYVAEIRRKGNRGKKTMSHLDAMKVASLTWPKKKAKLLRKISREGKKKPLASLPRQKIEVENSGSVPAKAD